MKRIFLALFLFAATAVLAQERVNLTAPETTADNTAYRVDRMTLIPDDPNVAGDTAFIHIQLVGIDRPNSVICSYTPTTTPTANTLLVGLNKANLSSAYAANATTGSLMQRINHRLFVMNEDATVCNKDLTGALSGNPL